ncbi:hypothetical protein [Sciscionella marina]|uniref:hypothetical protein n=1 Tax=Sciscionella marina TaxID=508770 RepID=UPI0012F63286|nr:hypothetical protein [Sciscionella marina]
MAPIRRSTSNGLEIVGVTVEFLLEEAVEALMFRYRHLNLSRMQRSPRLTVAEVRAALRNTAKHPRHLYMYDELGSEPPGGRLHLLQDWCVSELHRLRVFTPQRESAGAAQ